MDPSTQLWLFFGIVLGVVLLPGLDMTFVLATTLAGGRPSGFAGVAGITSAGFVHVAVGAAGIATVVTLLPVLFNALLVAGALYLGWIGWGLVRGGVALGDGARPEQGGAGAGDAAARERVALRVAFQRGMATNLLNPKAYAFMLAIFPQFVSADRGPIWLQALPLSAIIATTQVAVYGAVVLAAAGARGWLRGHPRVLDGLGRSVGALLLAAAATSAWQGWRGLS